MWALDWMSEKTWYNIYVSNVDYMHLFLNSKLIFITEVFY